MERARDQKWYVLTAYPRRDHQLILPGNLSAFQTAVSLAEYDAGKDEEGTILVTDQHLRSVVALSKDFKKYLYELHNQDEGKRAELRNERLDSFRGEDAS